jgi:hypothetical protein
MLRMHAWEMTDSLRESLIIVPPAETLRLPYYASVMTPRDTVIEKAIAGASTDGCVLKKVNGEWVLWKMAGGGRFYAPGPEDAPYISYYIYMTSTNRTDTVWLRPDTLHYGIQRFFSVDTADHQLLTFSAGDKVLVTKLLTNLGDAYDYLYFNGRRYEFKDTVKFDSVSPGIYRLFLEHIPATVLWEVQGEYTATVWGVPIRVVGGVQ